MGLRRGNRTDGAGSRDRDDRLTRHPGTGHAPLVSPSRGDVTPVSPRLPSGALLAAAAAAAVASLVMAGAPSRVRAAGPAVAGPVTPAARAASRAAGSGQTGTTAGDKIRRSEWWLSRLQV